VIPSITLDKLYEYMNKALKGSGVPNEEVRVVAKVKLPDEPKRYVYLSVGKAELIKERIPEEERVKMAGMYPPKDRAVMVIHCDIVGPVEE
jgi:hypothetical protein